jgi:hypothetical protein
MTPDPKPPSGSKSSPVEAAAALRDVLLQLAELGRKRREVEKLKSNEGTHAH